MQLEPNIIERAFELAGQCGSIEEVRHRLKAEGYFQVSAHLAGPQIRSELSRRLDPRMAKRKATPGFDVRKAAQPGGRVSRFPR